MITRNKYGFHDDNFQVWKKSLPPKILSSLAPTTQSNQNIANRSNKEINDIDKRAYSYIHPPQSF